MLRLSYFLILLTIYTSSMGQVHKIMTYNIRYDNPKDSLNNWDHRKAEVAALLKYYDPEIFGIQEGLHHQLSHLDQQLADYARIGVGRDDGKQKGEFCAIYYNKTKVSLIEASTFWLSEQPDTISVGWDAAMERICTYGIFEHLGSGKKMAVFNAHFDHIGSVAREKSAKLILKKIKKINREKYPVLLMGDFNAEPDSKPIKAFSKKLKDGGELSQTGIYGPHGTFTGFEPNAVAKRRIDYIFVKNWEVNRYRHIADKRKDGYYVSDHLPVLIELTQTK